MKVAQVEQRSLHTEAALDYSRRAVAISQSAGCCDVGADAYEVIRQVLWSKGDAAGAEAAATSKADLEKRPKGTLPPPSWT